MANSSATTANQAKPKRKRKSRKRCPFCKVLGVRVRKVTERASATMRRKFCPSCNREFFTSETVLFLDSVPPVDTHTFNTMPDSQR